jgi:hypothetical protein
MLALACALVTRFGALLFVQQCENQIAALESDLRALRTAHEAVTQVRVDSLSP